MGNFDVVLYNAQLADGESDTLVPGGIAIKGDTIVAVGQVDPKEAITAIDAGNNVVSPGFIDVHTHDDMNVIRDPSMTAKISQGVTTVVVGNCGISASPVTLNTASQHSQPPDPMHLLGDEHAFIYESFAAYSKAVEKAKPNVNVAALIGHTSLRNNEMDALDRAARESEICNMQLTLRQALEEGAIGLSTGLAYRNAVAAPKSEVLSLASVLSEFNAVYTTHLRSEAEEILSALDEAFETADTHGLRLIVSHIKCAGRGNWDRSETVLEKIKAASLKQDIACDCYPYTASSSSLDIKQVNEDTKIFITWSLKAPEVAGQYLHEIAQQWQMTIFDAAERLHPAGAIYHCMLEADVSRFLAYEKTMIGSDGIPSDPHPHPRLWGTFPRVLGRYSRDQKLFSIATAVKKMSGLPAQQFGLEKRGRLLPGYYADIVMFNPDTVRDSATYTSPTLPAQGIDAVWVNGVLSYQSEKFFAEPHSGRAGRMLRRTNHRFKES